MVSSTTGETSSPQDSFKREMKQQVMEETISPEEGYYKVLG